MARLRLQRQAEAEITIEVGGDLGVISDGSPVFRDEHGFRSIQTYHRADVAGAESLKQRRDTAFGWDLLFVLVELRRTMIRILWQLLTPPWTNFSNSRSVVFMATGNGAVPVLNPFVSQRELRRPYGVTPRCEPR